MTRLEVKGVLPGTHRPFQGEAVVVRVEPPLPGPKEQQYRVALLFQRFPEHDLDVLQAFLQS
jgi:hypothetical protein